MSNLKPYREGYSAFKAGKPLDSNPYPFIDEEGSEHQWWVSGWYDAQDDSKEG